MDFTVKELNRTLAPFEIKGKTERKYKYIRFAKEPIYVYKTFVGFCFLVMN
jgi:hypothetical protein